MSLPSVSLDTSKRRPRPILQVCQLSSTALLCLAGTTVLHAAVPIPNVICLHLLSDLTPHGLPN